MGEQHLDDAIDLLESLELSGRLNDHRRLLQFSCGCCRLIWDDLPDEGRAALELAEAYLAGRCPPEDLEAARLRLWTRLGTRSCDFTDRWVNALRAVICCLYETPGGEPYDSARAVMDFCNDVADRSEGQLALLREIFPGLPEI